MTSITTINAEFAEKACSLRALRSLPSSGDLQHEAIISQLHAGRELRTGFGMRQVVADVREVRALGAEARDDVDGFADTEMRRMWPMAQRVDDHDPHTLQERPRFVGDAVAVGQVREGTDPETEDGETAVEERHRHDFDAAKHPRSYDPEERQLRDAAALLPRRFEDVGKHAPQAGHCLGVSVAGNSRLLDLVVAPHV